MSVLAPSFKTDIPSHFRPALREEDELIEVLFKQDNIQVALVPADTNPKKTEQILHQFQDVFAEESWQPGDDLSAFPKASKYFVLSVSDNIAGILMLVIGNSDEGLSCLRVWPELQLHGRTDVADATMMVLKPEFRGQKLFWFLFVEMLRYCIRRKITDLWVEVTGRKIEIYQRFGWPLTIEGPLRSHWGIPSYPCKMSIPSTEEIWLARSEKSSFYKSIVSQLHRDPAASATHSASAV